MSVIKPTDRVCFNCAHGVFDEPSKHVVCHFMPPTPTLMHVPNPAAIHTPGAPTHALVNQALPPTVEPTWWCSQFKAKSPGIVS